MQFIHEKDYMIEKQLEDLHRQIEADVVSGEHDIMLDIINPSNENDLDTTYAHRAFPNTGFAPHHIQNIHPLMKRMEKDTGKYPTVN